MKILAVLILVIISCNSNHKMNFESGLIDKDGKSFMKIFEKDSFNYKLLLFDRGGNLIGVESYRKNLKIEELHFDTLSGRLIKKYSIRNNAQNGPAYTFYNSGNLQSSRSMVDGKEWYIGFDYWNDSIVINKRLLRFDTGKVYYELNFDSTGNPTTAKGKEE